MSRPAPCRKVSSTKPRRTHNGSMRRPSASPEHTPPMIRSLPRRNVSVACCCIYLAYISLRDVLIQGEDLTDEVKRPAYDHIAVRACELPGSRERRGCRRNRLTVCPIDLCKVSRG